MGTKVVDNKLQKKKQNNKNVIGNVPTIKCMTPISFAAGLIN